MGGHTGENKAWEWGEDPERVKERRRLLEKIGRYREQAWRLLDPVLFQKKTPRLREVK